MEEVKVEMVVKVVEVLTKNLLEQYVLMWKEVVEVVHTH